MNTVSEPDRSWGGPSRSAAAMPFDALIEGRPVPVGVPEQLQTMHPSLRVKSLRAEIAALEDRVRELSDEITAAHQSGRGSTVYLRAGGVFPRIVMTFDDNSAEPSMDEDLLRPLGLAVRAANRIYLHGHTDAFVASEAGTDLAIARTLAVRQVLTRLSVDPQRIRLFYRGAGSFAANNSTAEGKARNRRVEIELRKW